MAYYYNIQTKVVDVDTGAAVSAAVSGGRVCANGYYNGTEVRDLVVGGTLSGWNCTTRHVHISATISDGYEFVKFSFYCADMAANMQTQEFTANPMAALAYANYTGKGANTSAATAYAVTLTIYVRSTVKTVKVTFDPRSGTVSPTSKTVTVGQTYGTLPTPTRSGYVFAGWYTSASGGTKVTASSTVTNSADHKLYAHWNTPTPTTVNVTFDPNGGTVSPTSRTMTVGQAYGTLPTPTWSGHIFVGWYTSASGGTAVEAATVVENTSNHTIYAHWVTSGTHMRYDSSQTNLRLFIPPRFLFADRMTTVPTGLPDDVAVCPGPEYLQCVSCQNTTVGQTYDPGNMVFYSGVSSNKPINASGSVGGSTVSVSGESDSHVGQLSYYPGATYTPNKVVLAFDAAKLKSDGFKVYGWYWGTRPISGAASNGYLNGITNMHFQAGESLDVPADWLKGTDLTFAVLCIPLVRKLDIVVTFDPNGGTISGGTYFKRVYKGQTYGAMPTPTRSGYAFAGWYTAASGGTKVTSSTSVTNLADHTLYAHWTAGEVSVSVTFDPNGGTVSPTSRTVTVGKAYGTLPTPTRSGYVFAGWYTATAGGDRVTATTVVALGRDHSVYAHWTGEALTVTFEPNGGTVSETSRIVERGSCYDDLPTPTRADYVFAGWYTAAAGGDRVTGSDIPTGSVRLFAHWTEDLSGGEADYVIVWYKIRLETNGGTVAADYGELRYRRGVEKMLPTAEQVTRAGMTFAGWYAAEDFSGAPVMSVPATAKGSQKFFAKWI